MSRRAVCAVRLGQLTAGLIVLTRHLGNPRWRRDAGLVVDSTPKRRKILHNVPDGGSRVTTRFGVSYCHFDDEKDALSSTGMEDIVCLPVFHEVIFGCRPLMA